MPVRWSMGLPDHRLQGFEPPGSVRGFAPKPGVVLGPAQPRAVWHNAVGVCEGNREWSRMDANGWGWGSAILGKSRNGNRISRRVAEALRGGIRVLCGSASLRDTFSAGGCVASGC